MELRQQIISDIERLPEKALKVVNIFLRDIVIAEFNTETPDRHNYAVNKRLALFGSLKGKVQISDDFDEEMDEYGRFKSEPDFGKPVKQSGIKSSP